MAKSEWKVLRQCGRETAKGEESAKFYTPIPKLHKDTVFKTLGHFDTRQGVERGVICSSSRERETELMWDIWQENRLREGEGDHFQWSNITWLM